MGALEPRRTASGSREILLDIARSGGTFNHLHRDPLELVHRQQEAVEDREATIALRDELSDILAGAPGFPT